MSDAPRSFHDRVEAGIGFDWQALPPRVSDSAAVDPAAGTVRFERVRASHRGLARFTAIRRLFAYGVDPAFLEEIAQLAALDTLYMQRVTATDLAPLRGLGHLRRLVIDSPTRIDSLDCVAELSPSLQALAIENAPKVHDLAPLAALTGLRTLAVEGSLHRTMRVASLAPLGGLHELEALFLTALRVEDGRLAPMASLRRLRVLEFADDYAAGEIDALARALPDTRCPWFEPGRQKHRWEVRGLRRR